MRKFELVCLQNNWHQSILKNLVVKVELKQLPIFHHQKLSVNQFVLTLAI